MSLGEVGRFGVVGLVQNGTNLLVFWGVIQAGVDYRIAATVSASVALVISFCLNRWWTFGLQGSASVTEWVRYASVFLAATAAGVVLLFMFVELAGLPRVGAQAAAIATVAPASYALQRMFVFRRS